MRNYPTQSASSTQVTKHWAYPVLIEPRVSLEGLCLGGPPWDLGPKHTPSGTLDGLLSVEYLSLWEEH